MPQGMCAAGHFFYFWETWWLTESVMFQFCLFGQQSESAAGLATSLECLTNCCFFDSQAEPT